MGDSLSVGRFQEDNKKLTSDSQIPGAKESEKITRTREKLKQRLKSQEKKVTEENLNHTIHQIHDRIARLSEQRVFVKKGSLSLFDNNKNPAQSSLRVAKYAENILKTNKIFINPQKGAENSLKDRTIEAQ